MIWSVVIVAVWVVVWLAGVRVVVAWEDKIDRDRYSERPWVLIQACRHRATSALVVALLVPGVDLENAPGTIEFLRDVEVAAHLESAAEHLPHTTQWHQIEA